MKKRTLQQLILALTWLALAAGCSPTQSAAPFLAVTVDDNRVLLIPTQQRGRPVDITSRFVDLYLGQVEAPANPDHPFLFVSTMSGNRDIIALYPDGKSFNLTQHTAADHTPALSPSGKMVIFLSERDYRPIDPLPIEGSCARCEIYIMNLDGTRTRRLTSFGARISAPRWLNDQEIIYSVSGSDSYVGPCTGVIYRTNTETGMTTQISRSEGECDPLPSPDGKWILFDCVDNADDELCVIQPDGDHWTRLTFDPGAELDESWSADGQWILWTHYLVGETEIVVMNMNTKSISRARTSGLQTCNPIWSLGGIQIMFIAHCDGHRDEYRDAVYHMNRDGSQLSLLPQSNGLNRIVIRGWVAQVWGKLGNELPTSK